MAEPLKRAYTGKDVDMFTPYINRAECNAN